MRPQLPRKPMSSPPPPGREGSEADSTVDIKAPLDADLFSGLPVNAATAPRRLAPPPKPPMAAGPSIAANSTGTGMAPRRRAVPDPHTAATITAMRIISIGVEDQPTASEYSTPSVEAEPEPVVVPVDSVNELDSAPTEAVEIAERAEPQAFESASMPNMGIAGLRVPELTPVPAVETVEPPESIHDTPLAPVPEFEEEPRPSQQPQQPAVETVEPSEPRHKERSIFSIEPAPNNVQLPPLPVRAKVEPVELEEDDVAPDSIEPEHDEAPLLAVVPVDDEELAPESLRPEPPEPPSRLAASAVASVPEMVAAIIAPTPESSEAPGSSIKRNPPPPPRRSFPAPSEVTTDAIGAEPDLEYSEEPLLTPLADEAPTEKPKSEEKPSLRSRRPWWEELFNEEYSRAMSRLSDGQIKREASFIEDSLGVAHGGALLDLGCGPGYHAVELAGRGYAVVGYDLSLHQLALAADVAQERQQKLNLMQGDMREMAFDAVFDGIYCWNTTFGYFEEEKNLAVAERIFRALKPGGTFLIDVINRDFVTMQQPSSVWFEGDCAVCMDDMTVDFISSRLRVKRSVMLDDGRTRECPYSIRLYSLHELGKLLHDVGFRVAEASGDPSMPGVFMGQNAPRIIILAQRPTPE
jgi:SAM-dependent methyltransferase